ncbi:MAG: hypothetical protein HC771_24715, partial [Synechococcales cyanobacterium CRU_2_2]|nr:hypothetical protein [Synechococcales cyanobacterium CRU_2_2]
MTQDFTHSQDEDWQVGCAYSDRNLESLATLLFQFPSSVVSALFQDGDRVQ